MPTATRSRLTITVMARFGRWVFLGIDEKGPNKTKWEHCEVCDEHIRYVHVCQVDGDAKEWRIGSTFGPSLLEASEKLWGAAASEAKRRLQLLLRLQRLEPLEATPDRRWGSHLKPEWLADSITALQNSMDLGFNGLEKLQRRVSLAERHHGLQRMTYGPEA